MSLLRKTFFFTALFSCTALLPAIAQHEGADIAGIPDRSKQSDAVYIDAVKARMMEDYKQEETLLKEVIRLKPEEAAPYHDLAKLYQRQRKMEQAEQMIRKAMELNKENPWYLAAYAEILEAQSKTEQAAETYRDLAAKQKFNKEHIFQAARLFESAGRYKDAIAMMDKLIAQVGKEELLLMQKQQLYLRSNDLDGAVKIAQELIELNPREGRYRANLAELYNTNNQPEKALKIYEQATKEFPDDPSLQYGLAQYYKGKKDFAKYDEYIRRAILNRDFDDETQTTILFSYLQELAADSVRKKNSIDITRQLAAMHPNNAQILNLYGEVLLDNGQPEEAREQFRKVVTMDPSRFMAWQRLLFSYTDKKDADSLIRYSEKALRYFPNQAMVHYLNGIGHFNKNAYGAAVKSLNRAIDLQPEENKGLLADMYSMLGDVYNAAGKHAESDSSYEQALRLNPENASVLNNYAYYLSVRGTRLGEAEKMSKRSLELRPDEATFLDTYGWILYKQGNYPRAKEYIEKALERNPAADGTLWEHLGDISFRLNDKEKAVELWKKAKEKGTDNPQIDKKIQDKKLYE